MTVLSTNLINMGYLDASVIALLGYASVFLGLILLMIVVVILGKCFVAAEKRNAAKEAPPVQAEVVEEAPAPTAPGTAGQLKLHNVDPKTAAMLMAIVADKLNRPLNELRFISIKEVN